jgi:hypothetical protein
MTDRYARLNYGYSDERDCAEYGMGEKPQECLDGSVDAQYAVAVESMISNGFTFLTSSLIGSLSDEYGRKGAWEHGASARLYPDMLASAYYGPTPTSHTGVSRYRNLGHRGVHVDAFASMSCSSSATTGN